MLLKLKNKVLIINFITSFCYLGLVILLRNNSTWGVNDDYVIEKILNNNYPNTYPIVSFMSYYLGNFLTFLYINTKSTNIYGIFLHISNLFALMTLFTIFLKFKNYILIISSFTISLLLVPYLILNPTYTISSILISFSGFFLLLNLIKNQNRNFLYYLLSGLLISWGFLIRTDSLKGILIFLGFYFLIFLFIFKFSFKSIKMRISIAIIPIMFVLVQQSLLGGAISNLNEDTQEYLNFQSIRRELFYTPAILKLHQKVISDEIMGEDLKNVEFILFRNWIYADQRTYNSEVFKVGRDAVQQYIGVKGVLHTEINIALGNLKYYLSDVFFFVFLNFIIILFSLFSTKNIKKFLKLELSLFFGYLFSFYYAAAVLRLPIRVTLPYLIIFGILTLFNLEISEQKDIFMQRKLVKLSTFLAIFLLIGFNSGDAFGSKTLINTNSSTILWVKGRNQELLNFSQDAVFIGAINVMPASGSGPFLDLKNFTALNQSLVLDWSTFSPTWKRKAVELGLDDVNVYNSLSSVDNTFFVSNPELASILDFYMNDHEILRGQLCPVRKLSGTDDAYIFTYQAKENSC